MKDQFDYSIDVHWNDGHPMNVSLIAPSDSEISDGYVKIDVGMFSGVCYQLPHGISIHAAMTVDQLERLALKMLHACSVVRISAKEQKVKLK